MNTETKNNRPVRKAAMAIGLVAILVVIAWLSIMIVKNVPGSFASLASLAESVRSFDASQVQTASDDEATTNDVRDMLIVTSDINVIESNGDVRLSWTETTTKGSFVFSYECTDGVTIDIVDGEGVRSINCGTNYNLGDVNNITLTVNSEKERFVDVPYSIGFLASDDVEPSVSDSAVVTIVNDSVPLTFGTTEEIGTNLALVTEDGETEIVFEEEAVAEDEAVSEIFIAPEPASSETPVDTPVETVSEVSTPVALTPGTPFTQEYTYTIPVSNPNGYVDLATRFINTGKISNNAFVPGTLNAGEAGAIQFEVKNLGTKTSEEWTYSISLPNGGTVDSTDQEPLKPNERALITVGFPTSDNDEDFEVVIDTENDNVSLNDRFVY